MLTLARPRSAAHDVFVPAAGGPSVNLGDFNKRAGNFGLVAVGANITPDDWAALASAVFEPAGVGALLLGAAALLGRRRRRST